MSDVAQVVVAEVGVTRFGKYSDRGRRSLAEEAIHDALADPGLAPRAVPLVSNTAAGLEMIRGQVTLSKTGEPSLPEQVVKRAYEIRESARPILGVFEV